MTESCNQPRFLLLVTLLVLFLLTLQVAYVLRLPLVMDEFQGASDVSRLKDRVPYQDFRPYKTVLGYYIQMLVLLLRSSLWQGLINVKIQMAIFSAAALFFTSLRLRTHLRGPAVILGLGLTVVMTTFLERGADLRVDTLTALFGLFSLLLLMERRFVWAGALCAVSFLVSQKAVMDEFQGTSDVNRLTDEVPYRDVRPRKPYWTSTCKCRLCYGGAISGSDR